MLNALQLHLRENVDIYATEKGCVLVSTVDGKMLQLSSEGQAIANRLQGNWLIEDDAVEAADDASIGYYSLIMMRRNSMVDARLVKDNKALLTISPAPEDSAFRAAIDPATPYRLNPYAFLRQESDWLCLESPLTKCRVMVHDHALAVTLSSLCLGRDIDTGVEEVKTLVSVLVSLNLIEPREEPGENDPMAYWQFHDLLFYSRSLAGRHMYPLGGTYRFHGIRPSLPPVREAASSDCTVLPEPQGELLDRLSVPFGEVMETRRSRREFSDVPVTAQELGAFLYHTARIKEVITDHEHDEEASLRPAPSGGARHPLEIYPLIRQCDGVDPGIYRYDGMHHRLERLSVDPEQYDELAEDNPYELIGPIPPQVTLYLSARIGRTAWKYDAIAYKIINQDLGCLYQTFYLVATALELAPCALGSVDTDRLGKVMGIDWREEPFIGAFTLGK